MADQKVLPFPPSRMGTAIYKLAKPTGPPWPDEPLRSRYDEAPSRTFDGETYEPDLDGDRLRSQLARVKACLSDGQWWTLNKLAVAARGSGASVSARIRDLRKKKFGGHTIERRRFDEGLFEYRMVR